MSSWERPGQCDDWYTPKYIFDALGCVFDYDVAAPEDGPRYVPCIGWLFAHALDAQWTGFVFMNPPYGGRNGLEPWLTKFVDHGNGICIVPDRTSAPWFQEAAKSMDTILFVSPKVKFERPDGTIGESPGTGTALMAIGSKGNFALQNARKLGLLVRVK